MALKITIITPITTAGFFSEEEIKSLCREGLEVTDITLGSGPPSIESRIDEAMAVPAMIEAALQAEKDGAQALVISCMGDPGLGALREAVDIPVVGVAQTSMATATNLAHSFGIVTVLERLVPLLLESAIRYRYERQYVGCRSVDIPVLELEKRKEEVRERLKERALELVQKGGAEAIILGCGGLIGCAKEMEEYLRNKGVPAVPVIDPLPTAVSFAVTLIEQDLSHSKISFPKGEMK